MKERIVSLLHDARRAQKGGPEAVARPLRDRLARMVAHAREHSTTAVRAENWRVLEKQDLRNVTVERAAEPPEQSAGGKYRTVIPLV